MLLLTNQQPETTEISGHPKSRTVFFKKKEIPPDLAYFSRHKPGT
jgi:hypothetical protein